jgi:hypothetical protein
VITVVIPVSPIKSHPDTSVLDETLQSVRHHLPDAELIVTFDGIREQHEHRRTDYDEFTRRALWRLDKHYGNVCPLGPYDEHLHQTGMMRTALEEIRTPLVLYVESDTPLVTDEKIDFDQITEFITAGQSNLVRLSHEAHILEPHRHMFHGTECDGLFTRTSQWSQRPHIASVAYYRRILANHFTPNAKSFLEDQMHGVLDEAYRVDGIAGWMQHRVHMYTPSGNIKRSWHSDGRAGEPKFAETQTF